MELFNALSLKEVANIVNSLGASVDISSIKGCINTGDKLITYIKEGNELTAYSSEGMMTTVKIDYSCHEQRNTKYLSHPVTIEYYLKDGAVIRLSNDLSLPEGLEAFEYVQRHDLIHRMEVKYIDKDDNETTFSLGLGKVHLEDTNRTFTFTNEGIVYGSSLVSPDGTTLLEIDGRKAPSLEDIDSFDLERELGRIKKFANMDQDIHGFTAAALVNAADELTKKHELCKRVKNFYDVEIPDAKRALVARRSLIDAMNNSVLSTSDLEIVANSFRKEAFGDCFRK